MAVNFYDAINLFKASQTGRGNLGDSRQRTLAREVVIKLWQLRGENELGTSGLGNTFGDSLPVFWRDDIRVNENLDLPGASITLVHEAVHLIVDLSYIDEELQCRGLQLLYYPELLPPGLTYTTRVVGGKWRSSGSEARARRASATKPGMPPEISSSTT